MWVRGTAGFQLLPLWTCILWLYKKNHEKGQYLRANVKFVNRSFEIVTVFCYFISPFSVCVCIYMYISKYTDTDIWFISILLFQTHADYLLFIHLLLCILLFNIVTPRGLRTKHVKDRPWHKQAVGSSRLTASLRVRTVLLLEK